MNSVDRWVDGWGMKWLAPLLSKSNFEKESLNHLCTYKGLEYKGLEYKKIVWNQKTQNIWVSINQPLNKGCI